MEVKECLQVEEGHVLEPNVVQVKCQEKLKQGVQKVVEGAPELQDGYHHCVEI